MSVEITAEEALREVGVVRHPHLHYVKVDSRRGESFILHSHECRESSRPLTACPYAQAQDLMQPEDWRVHEDWPVVPGFRDGALVPLRKLAKCSTCTAPVPENLGCRSMEAGNPTIYCSSSCCPFCSPHEHG